MQVCAKISLVLLFALSIGLLGFGGYLMYENYSQDKGLAVELLHGEQHRDSHRSDVDQDVEGGSSRESVTEEQIVDGSVKESVVVDTDQLSTDRQSDDSVSQQSDTNDIAGGGSEEEEEEEDQTSGDSEGKDQVGGDSDEEDLTDGESEKEVQPNKDVDKDSVLSEKKKLQVASSQVIDDEADHMSDSTSKGTTEEDVVVQDTDESLKDSDDTDLNGKKAVTVTTTTVNDVDSSLHDQSHQADDTPVKDKKQMSGKVVSVGKAQAVVDQRLSKKSQHDTSSVVAEDQVLVTTDSTKVDDQESSASSHEDSVDEIIRDKVDDPNASNQQVAVRESQESLEDEEETDATQMCTVGNTGLSKCSILGKTAVVAIAIAVVLGALAYYQSFGSEDSAVSSSIGNMDTNSYASLTSALSHSVEMNAWTYDDVMSKISSLKGRADFVADLLIQGAGNVTNSPAAQRLMNTVGNYMQSADESSLPTVDSSSSSLLSMVTGFFTSSTAENGQSPGIIQQIVSSFSWSE